LLGVKGNLAQHVEDWRIAVDDGFRAGMVHCERQGEQARNLLRFAERLTFEGKRGEHHPACRISVSISDREIRRIFGVCTKNVLERADLRVQIIDMGLSVSVLKFRHQGRETRFYFPKAGMVITDLSW